MRPEDLLARLEAGYEYDPMYGQLCNERDRLKAENAKLKTENAKLMEFAKKLYGGYMGGRYMMSCNECERAYEDDGGYVPLDPDYCVFSFSERYVGCWRQKRLEAEMRELGIEVG